MTYTIDRTTYRHAEDAATDYGMDYDNATYPGLGESIALAKYRNPELSDHDITELAEAVYDHAHRPDPDAPSRSQIRRMVKGAGIPAPPPVPEWDADGSLHVPPRYTQEAASSFIVRAARRLARR